MIRHNGKEWKVCVVTPAGRTRYLEILKKYIYREMDKGLVDEWQLWKNTGVLQDQGYMDLMAEENPRVSIKDLGLNEYSAFNIHRFYQFTTDPDTVYLRFDDDIVFVGELACDQLVRARLNNPKPFVISANIVNNTLISWIHQTIGALDTEHGVANYTRFDEVAHQDAEFAENVHKVFMENQLKNSLARYYFPAWKLNQFNDFSISCFAFFGPDLAPINDQDEELWISHLRPKELDRPCLIEGHALVVHHAYHTQREYLDTTPHIYGFYSDLCEKG